MFIELHYKNVEGNPAFVINTDYIMAIDSMIDGTAVLSVLIGNDAETTKVVESYEEVVSRLP